MKRIFLIILICLSASIYAQETKIDTIVGDKKHFIPLDTCYYNVYTLMSGFKNKKIKGTDTIFISKKLDWKSYSTYWFKNFGAFLVRNDTLFSADVAGPMGGDLIRPIYWSVKKNDERHISCGGDAICGTQYSEPIGYYKIGNKVYANCYKFSFQSHFSGQIVIIAYGIGIISISNGNGVKILSSVELKKNCRK